jgi:hypothetical protein
MMIQKLRIYPRCPKVCVGPCGMRPQQRHVLAFPPYARHVERPIHKFRVCLQQGHAGRPIRKELVQEVRAEIWGEAHIHQKQGNIGHRPSTTQELP